MNRLHKELERLYGAHDCPPQERALVLEVARPASWADIGCVWQGVQSDLGLPAPAIAVNGRDGYQLWFSLREALSPADGLAFLRGLQRRYLAEVAQERITIWPELGNASSWPATPQPLPGGEHWSAFVAPDLAPIFGPEPWLDIPPGDDAQADTLLGLKSMAPADLLAVLGKLAPGEDSARGSEPAAPSGPGVAASVTALNPRDFLRQVMQDPNAPLALRVEAAKALLPYEH